MFVNIAYVSPGPMSHHQLHILNGGTQFIVVPLEDQLNDVDVASTFFEYTFGTVSSTGNKVAPRVLAAFMAVSSLGNIIVMTYTAARGTYKRCQL